MRIAIFTEVFLPKIDGVVTRLARTIEQLAAMSHDAIIFAPGNPPARYAGFPVVKVPSIPFKPIYPEISIGIPTRRITSALKAFRPDVIHAVNPAILAAYGVMVASRDSIPLVASYHTQLARYVSTLHLGFLRPVAQWWTRTMHNHAQVNLCTSPQMLDYLRSDIANLHLWPKAVDTSAFSPVHKSDQMRLLLSDNHPQMPLAIYAGRLSNEKDLDDLLDVVHRMSHMRFAFIGSGPAYTRLTHLFAGTNTVFTGYLAGHALSEAYASADVFLFPSTTETLGLAALESMASGVPVIGADAGGIPHLIHDGVDGFLVPAHDSDQIVKTLTRLVCDDELRQRMGKAARAEAEKYSWEESTRTLVDYYQMAIDASHD